MSTVQTHDQPTPGSGAWLPFLLLMGLILAVLAGLYSGLLMRPTSSSIAQISAPQPGESLDAVVEVTGTNGDGTVNVGLLTRRGDGYIHSGKMLKLRLMPRVKFVMGGRDALRPGAVLQVHAVAGGRDLEASEVVFLTGYVKVG